jgi:hypothetical protein
MKQDKAIIKALKSQEVPVLTDDFNSRLMKQLYVAVEKKKRRDYILTLCLISTVSLGLISMGIYLMKDSLAENFTFQWPTFKLLAESISKYGFSIYIAILIFILVGLDTFFRNVRNKHKEEKLN